MMHQYDHEKWINNKFAYSKKDFTIWEIEMSTLSYDNTYRFRIVRWPIGTDAHLLTTKELCDKFYTVGEYKEIYEKYKDCVVNAPYEIINDAPRDDVHDERLTFVQLLTNFMFLYRYEYDDNEGHHDHLVKLSTSELYDYANNKTHLFELVYGIVINLEVPINEW